jgi:hypothetical protein
MTLKLYLSKTMLKGPVLTLFEKKRLEKQVLQGLIESVLVS